MSTESTVGAEVLAAVLDATDTALALTDPRGRIRWVNQPMADLLDLTAEQAANRSLPALIAGIPTEPGPDGVIISLAAGEGEHRWLEARCTALPRDRLLYRVADISRWREQSVDPDQRGAWETAAAPARRRGPAHRPAQPPRAHPRAGAPASPSAATARCWCSTWTTSRTSTTCAATRRGTGSCALLADVLRERLDNGHALGRLGGDEFAVVLHDTDEESRRPGRRPAAQRRGRDPRSPATAAPPTPPSAPASPSSAPATAGRPSSPTPTSPCTRRSPPAATASPSTSTATTPTPRCASPCSTASATRSPTAASHCTRCRWSSSAATASSATSCCCAWKTAANPTSGRGSSCPPSSAATSCSTSTAG